MRTHNEFFFYLVVVAIVATSACQSATPVPTPIPDPSTPPPTPANAPAIVQPQLGPTVLPAPTTKPQPTSLPTLPKSESNSLPPEQASRVVDGRAALAAGDYGRAVSLLEPLIDQLGGEPQAEVRLLHGQGLVGERHFDAGLAAAAQVLESTTRADLVSAARLLKGQALRGQKRWDAAAAEMRAVADANPLVAAGVRLELTDMWLVTNRPDEAATDGKKGLDAAQPRLLKIELAENLGKAEVALQHTDAAMDAYRQLLTAAGSKGYLGEQLYNLAEGASQLGRVDDAITALRTSISQFPRSRKAPDAVVLLEKLGGMRAEDRFFAGIIRYYFWSFAKARADFDAYMDEYPDGDRAVEARYYRALSSAAKETTTQLLQLARDVPDDDFAPMALLEAGKAQEELGDYASAEGIYDRLIAAYPTRDAGMAGAFRRGLARHMRGDESGALAVWDDLLGRDPPPAIRAEALYWSGKSLAAAGEADRAHDKYQSAAAVRPVDYYVMRAQVALAPPPVSKDFEMSKAPPTDETDLGRWFASHGLDLDAAARVASQDPAVVRATALAQHGLYRQANWEYEIFLTTSVDKPDRLYWLAARFGELGLPNAQLKLGTAALKGATAEGQVSILDVPPALARVASPLAFADMVVSTAKGRGLDPLLFTSLMHQESDFDAYVESVAKAKGLSQIIPQTGNEIATALGVRDFRQEDLYQPRLNIRFGAYYFAERLKRNGSIDRALASYNAGDGNVDHWTGPGREDPDVFVEYIPFLETHDYVKKVLSYWWINRYLWAR